MKYITMWRLSSFYPVKRLETRTLKYPRFVKCILFSIILILLVFLLRNNAKMPKHIWRNGHMNKFFYAGRFKIETDDPSTLAMHLYDVQISTFQSLEENPESCFLESESNAADYHTNGSFRRSELNRSTVVSRADRTYFYMNFLFNKILKSLDIKAAIIEPSVLHCSLNAEYKDLLKRRNISIADFNELRTTYGLLGKDAAKLQNEDNVLKFQRFGYQPIFVQASLADWMFADNTYGGSKTYISHIIYMYHERIIHIVVFQKRSSYLWHAALETGDFPNVPRKEDLLFVNYDSAYEKFSFVSLESKYQSLSNIYVPSDPQHFLFQINSSRFLECNSSRAEKVKSAIGTPTAHTHLSVEKFNDGTLASLRELKFLFHSLLANFWIFSGTMLGWYRQCDIIPYTSDVDFAAWASEIDNLDYIINYFLNNRYLTIIERMGVLEEALEFQLRHSMLRVDIFFMYRINNGSWISGHQPNKGYYYRSYYPPFSLCSAELLGEKVNVPCETEDVIMIEYGSEWMSPVSSWNYETSVLNRGPDIYWDEKTLKEAFQEY